MFDEIATIARFLLGLMVLALVVGLILHRGPHDDPPDD